MQRKPSPLEKTRAPQHSPHHPIWQSQGNEEAKMSMDRWKAKEDLLQGDKVNLAIKKHNQETFLSNVDGRKERARSMDG